MRVFGFFSSKSFLNDVSKYSKQTPRNEINWIPIPYLMRDSALPSIIIIFYFSNTVAFVHETSFVKHIL